MAAYDKNEVIKILMERDEMSREEALNAFNDMAEEINEAIEEGDNEAAEEVLQFAGFEPDYFIAFGVI